MALDTSQLATTTVNRIPIKNIWLLLLYASDLYKSIGEKQRVELENNPEDLIDLVGKLFCATVEKRLARELSVGYTETTASLNRVRGRIDHLTTTSKQLLAKGKVHCHYETLTIDTPKNRYVHAAVIKLLSLVKDNTLIHQCNKLINRFTLLGVGKSNNYSIATDRFIKSDILDQQMVSLAHLIFNFAIPTELAGLHQLEQVQKTDYWLRHLFEKAIVGFYQVNLEKDQWKVLAGKKLSWQQEEKTENIDRFFPTMKTDLIIEHLINKHKLIIDTKCTSILKKGRYREQSFKTDYIYQLYAYLRSQEKITDPLSLTSSGMLLHPAIDISVNEAVTIQGHKLKFCTIDLAQDALTIKSNLLRLLDETFN